MTEPAQHDCLADALAAARSRYSWARIKECARCGREWVSLDTKSRNCAACGPQAANATKRAKAHARVEAMIRASDGDQCVEWPWQRKETGYGIVSIDGVRILAHREVYRRVYGDLPDDLVVLHECDNPPCVNYRHLRKGTKADNNHDKHEKGRSRNLSGEQHGRAKLSEGDIAEIRASAGTLVSLSKRYGVAFSTISKIKRRLIWRHVR